MSTALAARPRPGVDGPRREVAPTTIEKVVAVAALVVFGLRPTLIPGVHLGIVVALVLAPVWIPRLRRYAGATTYVVLGVLCVVAGVILTQISSSDRDVSTFNLLTNSVLVLGLVLGAGLVIWTREIVGTPVTALAFGAGVLAAEVLAPSPLAAENPWKFAYGIPIIIIGMAIVAAYRRRTVQVLLLFAFAITSGLADSRSYLAELALAALLLMLAHLLLTRRRITSSPAVALAGIAIVGLIVYYAATAFLVEGLFGTDAQVRTVEQIDRTGSVLLGARPEIAASFALMAARFGGYGAGTLPNGTDIQTAKSGMAALNYQPDNGYVENYMFGSKIELHSVAGDVWAIAGPIGIAFAVFSAILLLRYLAHSLTGARVTGVVLFLAILTLWNLGFSPLLGSSYLFPLAIGLAVIPRRPRPAGVGIGRAP